MARIVFILLMLAMAWSCDDVVSEKGNGQIESQKRTLQDFSEISLKGNYQVTLKPGSNPQVVIVTDENLLDYINTGVEDEVLIIENLEKIYSKDGVKLFITYQGLTAIQSAGASVIKSEEVVSGEKFHLDVTGAGLVELEVEVEEFHLDLPGAGLVKLSGKASDASFNLAGVGNLEAFNLVADNCEVNVSGLGGAQVHVKENLKASVNGIGGIKYKGDPTSVQDEVSGIGTIKKAESRDEKLEDEEI